MFGHIGPFKDVSAPVCHEAVHGHKLALTLMKSSERSSSRKQKLDWISKAVICFLTEKD
jgi:hypothetical protein